MPAGSDGEFQQRIERIEALVREIEGLADEDMRAGARELVGAILDLHGAGLARVLDLLAEAGAAGGAIVDRLTADDLVASLLLLHGLHPLDPEARVQGAIEKVRPELRAAGGNVELLGVVDGVARLRVDGDSPGWRGSSATLKAAIEAAVYGVAPDIERIVIEGLAEERPPGFIPLSQVIGAAGRDGSGSAVTAMGADGRAG